MLPNLTIQNLKYFKILKRFEGQNNASGKTPYLVKNVIKITPKLCAWVFMEHKWTSCLDLKSDALLIPTASDNGCSFMLCHRKTLFLLLGCSGTYLKALPQQDHSLSPCVFSSLPWTLGILSTSPSSVAVSLIFVWGSYSPPHRHSSPSTDSLGHVLLFPTGYPLSGRKPFVNGTGCWIHHVNSLDPRYGVCVF